MGKTYETLYENEVRAITISIRDQEDSVWVPASASAWVVDSDGEIVVAETTATVSSNTVTFIIDTVVTSTHGTYELIWKISKPGSDVTYIYYHKTLLSVEAI
jgi:hypothetical protein